MGGLDRREWSIVFNFVLSLLFMLLAIAEFIVNDGAHTFDFVELSFLSLIMSRVL